MSCYIWNKDSNILFDYETSDCIVSNATISSSGQIIKCEKKALFTKKIDHNNPNAVAVIQTSGDEFYYKFEEDYNNTKSMDDKAWIVIKNMYNKNRDGYKLREGDIIKLGKVMFKIRELKSDENSKNEMKKNTQKTNAFDNNPGEGHCVMNTQQVNRIDNPQKITATPLPVCRICLMDDNDIDNPLINPCKCTGSVRFIHLQCIKQWLKSKIVTKTFNFLIVHSFKGLECEICKAAIPEHMKYKNEMITLTEFVKPESNYIMLENISREKRENRYLYIIKMKDKNTINLGRANDADVRITDISVSRNHATLSHINGKFVLDDKNSKFGTLSLIQNDILFYPSRPISIQCGRLHLFFELIKTCFAWIRCYNSKHLSGQDYNDQLEAQGLLYHQFELDNLLNLDTEYAMSFDSSSKMKNSTKKITEGVYQVNNDKEDAQQLSQENSEKNDDQQNERVTNNDVTPNQLQANCTNKLLCSQININSVSAVNLLAHSIKDESKFNVEPHRNSHYANNQATNNSCESPMAGRPSGFDLLNNNVLTIKNYYSNTENNPMESLCGNTQDNIFFPVENEINRLSVENFFNYIPNVKHEIGSLRDPYVFNLSNTGKLKSSKIQENDQMLITPTQIQTHPKQTQPQTESNIEAHFPIWTQQHKIKPIPKKRDESFNENLHTDGASSGDRIIASMKNCNKEELDHKKYRHTTEKNLNDKKRISISQGDFFSEGKSIVRIYSLPQSPTGHILEYKKI